MALTEKFKDIFISQDMEVRYSLSITIKGVISIDLFSFLMLTGLVFFFVFHLLGFVTSTTHTVPCMCLQLISDRNLGTSAA